MILPLQHSVLDAFPVDPTFVVNSTNRILAGSVVGLNAGGKLARTSTTVGALGLAGDSASDEYKTTAYSAEVIVSPTGAKRWTSSRLSDHYNETLASGLMSVYFGTGKFATDQYVASDTYTPGVAVYANAAGQLTATAGSGSLARRVGFVAEAPRLYSSGVDGVDAPSVDNSMALGTFLTIHLNIG